MDNSGSVCVGATSSLPQIKDISLYLDPSGADDSRLKVYENLKVKSFS